MVAATVDIEKLRQQLLDKHDEALSGYTENTAYYESLKRPDAIGMAAPPELQKLYPHIGYPRLYVNALAARIRLEGFKLPGQGETDSELWEWWAANRLDTEFNLGCVEALVHGRAYITIGAPPTATNATLLDENAVDDDIGAPPLIPIIRVESPLALYADVDPWTRRVTQAIRVYKNDEDEPDRVVIYLPDQTVYQELDENKVWQTKNVVSHNLGVVPVVPLMNRTKLSDQIGASEITPELRSFTDAAGRLLTNMQAAAELMAVPQRVIFGIKPEDLVGPNGQRMSTFEAYMAQILAVSDAGGKVDQFQAAQLQNFADGLREIRNEVAAYTGLPPQYLSNSQDNPASAEAIRSSESRLVLAAEMKCQVFGGDLEEAMRIAYRIAHAGAELPADYYRLQAVFRNPATPTYEAKADAATKAYANGNGVIPKEQARIDMGYGPEEREQMRVWDQEEQQEALALVDMYAQKAVNADEPGAVPDSAGDDSPASPPADDPVR